MTSEAAIEPRDLTRWVTTADPAVAARLADRWDELAGVIDAALARARTAWPALHVPTEVLVTAMTRGVREAAAPLTAFGELRVEDLYLAQACAAGAPGAIEAFTATANAAVLGSLRTMGLADDVIADVSQEVWSKLLVATDTPPKIATYSGRAALTSWVRTIATRAAVDRLRRPEAASASDEVLEALPDAGTGPELAHFRARYAGEFKEAFETALASLELRERNVLRHHFVDGLAFEEIGVLYGVHKTTAYRWLETARDKLSKRTRSHFQRLAQVTPLEIDSVLRLLQSNLELSLSRVLA